MLDLPKEKRVSMGVKAFHQLGEKYNLVNYYDVSKKVILRTEYKNLFIMKDGNMIPMFDKEKEYTVDSFLETIRENDTVYFYEEGKAFPKVLNKVNGDYVVPEKETKDEKLMISFDRLEKNGKEASYNAINEMEDKSPERINLYLLKCGNKKWLASKEEIEYAMKPENKILSSFQIERLNDVIAGKNVQIDEMSSVENLLLNSMLYSKYKDICAYNSVELLDKKIKEDFPKLEIDKDRIAGILTYKADDNARKKQVDELNSKDSQLSESEVRIEKHIEKIKYNSDRMKQVFSEVNKLIFDNAYIADKSGEKHYYRNVREFDALMKKFGPKDVFTEASRPGNEFGHVMMFLNANGITYENYKELLEYPETEKAKEVRNKISSLKQKYADYISVGDPETIADVYSKVLCKNADEMTNMLASVDNWESLEKNLDKISYFQGGQSTLAQTFNLGSGGSKASDQVFAKLKEKCAKEGINSSAYIEVMATCDSIAQRFEAYFRRHGNSFYEALEDNKTAADFWGAVVATQYAKRMLVNTDRSVVNNISSLCEDVTVIRSLQYEGKDSGEYLKTMENGIDEEDVQLFFDGNISQEYTNIFSKDDCVEKWDEYCSVIQEMDEKDRVKDMSSSKFNDCINEKTEKFTIFTISETARYFREHPAENKSFDEMSLLEQNMAASRFFSKNMYVLSHSPSAAESLYKLFNAEERKLFARALNLTAGSKEFGNNKSLNDIRNGIFNELAKNDLAKCIEKEIELNGGSEHFRKVSNAMEPYVAACDYLDLRYGASTHNGKVRLGIVEKYADVLCKNPEKRFTTEFDYISKGDQSEEYQAFRKQWKAYIELKSNKEKIENLQKLADAASHYMEMKGDSKRSTQQGQRRYDLAKKINEYSLLKRRELIKEEILNYGIALKEGKDVSEFSADAKDYYILYKHIQISKAKEYSEWMTEKNINEISLNDDLRLNQAIELWDAYKSKDKASQEKYIRIFSSARNNLWKFGIGASLENTDYQKFKNRQDEETFKKDLTYVTDMAISYRNSHSVILGYSKTDTILNYFQVYNKNREKGIESFMKSLRIAVKDESVPGKNAGRFVLIDAQKKVHPLFGENDSLTDEEAYDKLIGYMSDGSSTAYDVCYCSPENAHYLKLDFRDKSIGLCAEPSNYLREFESVKKDFDDLRENEAKQDNQRLISKLDVLSKESKSITQANNLLKPVCNPDSTILHRNEFSDYVNESDLSEEICIAICSGASLSLDNLRKQKATSSSALIMDEGEDEMLVNTASLMMYDNLFTQAENTERMSGFISAVIEGRKLTESALRDVKNGNYEKATEYLLNLKRCIINIATDKTMNISTSQIDLVERMLDRYDEAAKDPRFSDKLEMTHEEKNQLLLFRNKRAIYKEKNKLAVEITDCLMKDAEVPDEKLKKFIGITSILKDMDDAIEIQGKELFEKSIAMANEEKERKEKQNIEFSPVEHANLQTLIHSQLIKNREFTVFEKEILYSPDKLKEDYAKYAEGKYEYKLFKSLKPEELLSVIEKEIASDRMGFHKETEVGIKFGDLSFADKIQTIMSYGKTSRKTVLEPGIIYSFRESMLPSFPEELQDIYLSAAKGEKNQNIDKLPDYAKMVLASELYHMHKKELEGCDTPDFAAEYFEKRGISENTEITKTAFGLSKADTSELAMKIEEKGYSKVSPYIRRAIESETDPKERIILIAKIYQLSQEFTNRFSKEDTKYLQDQVMNFLRPVKTDYLGNESVDEETVERNLDMVVDIYTEIALEMGEEKLQKKAELDKVYPGNIDEKNRDINLELAKHYASFGENQSTKEAFGFIFFQTSILDEKDIPRLALFKDRTDDEMAYIGEGMENFRENCTEENRKLYDLGIDTSVNLKKTDPGYNAIEFKKMENERRFKDAERLAEIIPQAREAEKQELDKLINKENVQKQNKKKTGIKHLDSTVNDSNRRKLRMEQLENEDIIKEVEDEEGWEMAEDEDFNDLDKSFTINDADDFERDQKMKNVLDSLNAGDSSKTEVKEDREQINFKDFLAEDEKENENISRKRLKTHTRDMGKENGIS